jgi:EmrB/QacA subfamily drug resistance transporter
MSQPGAVTRSPDRRRWGVLVVISFALFVILLDVTIVNIALPHIMTAFNVGLSSIEWVFNVYVLVFASLLLTLGKLGDLFGRKLLFVTGLSVFTLASLGCSLSPSFSVLLLFRGIQAVGGAAMMPATLSLLNVEFSKSQRGLALGVWGAVAGAANALGPIVGGALVDAASWRYIFVINVPIGILAFIAALIVVRESTGLATSRRIDVPGVILISTTLFCLTFALVEGQKYGWASATILGLFAAAFAGLVAFVLVELRTQAPLAQLRLFRNRVFSAGNFIGVVQSFGLIGVIYLLVLFLQIVLGFSALKAGLTLLPLPIAIMVVAPFAGRLTDAIGGRWLLFTGTLITALGVYLMTDLSGSTGWADLVLPLAICGAGMGLVMAPTTTVVMASTPVEQSGTGAGILSTTRQIGSVLGLSVLGAVLQNQLASNTSAALARIPGLTQTVTAQIVAALQSGGIRSGSASLPGALPDVVKTQIVSLFRDQFAHSLNVTMRVAIVVVLLGTVSSLLVSSRLRRGKST